VTTPLVVLFTRIKSKLKAVHVTITLSDRLHCLVPHRIAIEALIGRLQPCVETPSDPPIKDEYSTIIGYSSSTSKVF
jgi:hypothetical protein